MTQNKNYDSITKSEVSWIRSSEIFRIIANVNFPTLFSVSMLVVLMAANSSYSKQKCPNMQTSIEIIDESGGRKISGNSVDTLANSPFKNYVTAVSQYVTTKMGETTQCVGNASNSPELKLFFVYRSVSVPSKLTTSFALERSKSSEARYLNSPWTTLIFSHSPKLSVRGLFIWNERQFLVDQARLSGVKIDSNSPLLPIEDRTLRAYVADYTNSVLFGPSPVTESVAQNRIAKRVPADILWMFRYAWQSTRGPFANAADSALRNILQRAEPGYTNLAKHLVNELLESTQTEIRYDSVLDLEKTFSIDKYRIKRLY